MSPLVRYLLYYRFPLSGHFLLFAICIVFVSVTCPSGRLNDEEHGERQFTQIDTNTSIIAN